VLALLAAAHLLEQAMKFVVQLHWLACSHCSFLRRYSVGADEPKFEPRAGPFEKPLNSAPWKLCQAAVTNRALCRRRHTDCSGWYKRDAQQDLWKATTDERGEVVCSANPSPQTILPYREEDIRARVKVGVSKRDKADRSRSGRRNDCPLKNCAWMVRAIDAQTRSRFQHSGHERMLRISQSLRANHAQRGEALAGFFTGTPFARRVDD